MPSCQAVVIGRRSCTKGSTDRVHGAWLLFVGPVYQSALELGRCTPFRRPRRSTSSPRRHHQPWRRAQTSSAELIDNITSRMTVSWAQWVLSLTITFMP